MAMRHLPPRPRRRPPVGRHREDQADDNLLGKGRDVREDKAFHEDADQRGTDPPPEREVPPITTAGMTVSLQPATSLASGKVERAGLA